MFSSAFSAKYAFQAYTTGTGPRCKAGQWVQTTVLIWLLLLLGLSYQLLPVIAHGSPSDCMCPFQLQRLKCIPKPTAKPRASASFPGPCLEQSLCWLRRSLHCSTGYQVTNCVPAIGIIRTVRGNSLRSLITSDITTYAFCISVVCSHQWRALGSFQTVKTGSSNSFPKCDP